MDIENKYYNAKQIKADNPEEAIAEFLGVPALEQEKGDWYVTLGESQALCEHSLNASALKGLQRAEASDKTGVQTEAI